MFLKICDENWLFAFNHIKYIDALCVFSIFLCIVLMILLNNFEKLKSKKHVFLKRLIVSIMTFMLLLGLSVVMLGIFNEDKFNHCACKFVTPRDLPNNIDFNLKFEVKLERVIIIGDSRMEYIVNGREGKIDIPKNFEFIAKSGMTIDWFKDTALPKLYKILDKKEEKYNYYVVINMGVNDITYTDDIEKRSYEYFDYYKRLSSTYPDVEFYLLSVNPVSERLINYYFPTNRRTNEKIEKFNEVMIRKLVLGDYKNITYCDSYTDIYFRTKDGLHYTKKTNQEIIDYIDKKCVVYKEK